MNNFIVSAIFGCLFFVNGFSQTASIEKLLIEIEKNNTELKGYQSFMKSQQLENNSTNNLPDPQFSGYYMPFGDNITGDYTEYEISQSFEFPTVYATRNKWNNLKADQLRAVYAKKRQEVLLKAKVGVVNFYFFQKQKRIEEDRKLQSQKVYEQIEELFNKEQVGILDLNKAKIAWLQEQFEVEQLQVEIQNQKTVLQNLNGGQPLELENLQIELPLQLKNLETIWNEKLAKDPKLLELKANEATALQKISLEKNKILPNLALGYNYQGVSGNNYSGVYGGVSIPLWNSKNKVKSAQAHYEYQQSSTQVASELLYSQFQQDHYQYQLLYNKFIEYQETVANLNSEDLLFKAYTLGEFSFLNYYMEIQFYRNATNEMLHMEKQMQLLQAQLLIHQL